MGYGSYSASDWSKLKTSRKLDTASTNEIFSKKKADDKFLPKFFDKREARDSEEHPNSTPIMIGVDVTGSMGYLSTQIIKESLNELMMKLYSTDLITDPQLLFAAIGDAKEDEFPLQVTQFETDIRIAEQLMDLYLENGGGDGPEDYSLLWYFAAKHTETDSYEKRKEKGFCFTIGDAPNHTNLPKDSLSKIFGDKKTILDISTKKLATQASEKYELFHIAIDGRNTENLSTFIPGRVIYVSKNEINYLPEIMITVMQIVKGVDKEEALKQWGDAARTVVNNAIADLTIAKGKTIRL